MSGKYDIEAYLGDLLAVVQNNLPTKIAAINAEKGDSYIIHPIKNENYFNNPNDQIFNISPFIYYGLVDISTNTNGSKTSMELTVNFEVVFNNINESGTLEKTLRYTRCLKEVVQENFKSAKHSGLKIDELIPASAELNQGADFKVGGVKIVSTITG